MPDLRVGKHSYFTTWANVISPETNRAAGPADEFDTQEITPAGPPGYENAKPGELFLKIGVGWLRKPSNEPYVNYQPYEIADSGKWLVTQDTESVVFNHELPFKNGLGYAYEKRMRIRGAERTLVVSQTLKNIGSQTLRTVNYCHNFISIDGAPSRTEYSYFFSSPIMAPSPLPDGDSFENGRFGFRGTIGDRVLPFKVGKLEKGTLAVRIENSGSGASVEVKCPSHPEKFQMYATGSIICPEFFVRIELAPQEEATWEWSYTFSSK